MLRNNNKKGFASLSVLKIGLFELGFVAVIIAAILLFLNYFNIVSLSTLYPDKFGWLPQKEQTSVGSNDYKDVTVERLPKPQELSVETKTYAVNGFFESRDGNSFIMALSTDVTTFNFDGETTFLKVDTTKNPSETTQYPNAEVFFSQVKPGDLLFVTYVSLEQGFRAEQVQYMVQK